MDICLLSGSYPLQVCEHTTTHSEDKNIFVRVHSSSVANDAHNATVSSDCLADLENLTYIKIVQRISIELSNAASI